MFARSAVACDELLRVHSFKFPWQKWRAGAAFTTLYNALHDAAAAATEIIGLDCKEESFWVSWAGGSSVSSSNSGEGTASFERASPSRAQRKPWQLQVLDGRCGRFYERAVLIVGGLGADRTLVYAHDDPLIRHMWWLLNRCRTSMLLHLCLQNGPRLLSDALVGCRTGAGRNMAGSSVPTLCMSFDGRGKSCWYPARWSGRERTPRCLR